MSETQNSGRKSEWYTIKVQRVARANFSVTKDGVLERPSPSWSDGKLDVQRSRHVEPWNVENVNLTSNGIEVSQYAKRYTHPIPHQNQKVQAEDRFSWSVCFKPQSMKGICLREFQGMTNHQRGLSTTFIELCFKYEGLPESRDSSQLKTVQPQEEEGVDEGVEGGEALEDVLTSLAEGGDECGEAKTENDPEVTMEDSEDLEENIEGEGDGKGVEIEVEGEAVMEGEEEVEEGEAVTESEEEEEETPMPDQFDLAKLFAGPNNFKDLEVRITFVRSLAIQGRWQWQWPAVVHFLRGSEGWTPRTKMQETQRQVRLSLNDWILEFGNQGFVARTQVDGTTKWTMPSAGVWQQQQQQQQQMPSHSNVTVPAFGTPLPRAPQVPQGSPASRQPTSFPIPVQSRKRTLPEMEDEDDELEREEERLSQQQDRLRQEQDRLRQEQERLRQEQGRVKALRKQLKESRKQGYYG